jgi:dTDP-4-amino-4,6-dideoxygalactose transaminase
VKEGVLADIADLIDSGAFSNGPAVAAFEAAYADHHGARHCVGVGNGLDGLRLALIGAGLEPGDEVIVPAMTFVATFEAVTQAGCTPVPVDVTPDTYTLDPDALAAALTARTRAVMPVHLYGQMADMVAVRRFATAHDLVVIEDACQSHGAVRDGILAGRAGTAAAFSFYPTKNLGAMGDAGAVLTDDDDLADRLRALREHGQRLKYEHDCEGYTSRLDTMQAIVLLHKLPYLAEWTDQRVAAAALYGDLLEGIDELVLPFVADASAPVWHVYVVQSAEPEALAERLRSRGIGVGRHYPVPPHLTGAYARLGYGPDAFPVAEALARDGLSLPIFPGITARQVETVADAVRGFYGDV